jgi:hypothetical protein
MIVGSCHCGAVRLEVDAPPDVVTDCACSICRRKGSVGLLFADAGAHHPGHGSDVDLHVGRQEDRVPQLQDLRVLDRLGAGRQELRAIGVSMRMMELEVLAAARVEKITGP